jgi:hypothetical protein
MESSTSRLSKEMEVQQKKAMPHQGSFSYGKPYLIPFVCPPWVSMLAPFFPSGLRYDHGSSTRRRGSQKEGIKMEFMFSKLLKEVILVSWAVYWFQGKRLRNISPWDQEPSMKKVPLSSLLRIPTIWHFHYSF